MGTYHNYPRRLDPKKISKLAGKIDRFLRAAVGRRLGFHLIVSEFGDPKTDPDAVRSCFASNGVREDMIKAVREWLIAHERGAVRAPGTGNDPRLN